MENLQIYKVTFCMMYDYGNEPVFTNELHINTIDGLKISVPVYVRFDGERLIELVTGTEIPIIRRKDIPGFGAYTLSLVYTINDYRESVYYLDLCSNCKESFKSSLDSYREYFNKQREDFISTNADSFGPLAIFSAERESTLQAELKRYVKIVEKIVVPTPKKPL